MLPNLLYFGVCPTIKLNRRPQILYYNPTLSLKFNFWGALDECMGSPVVPEQRLGTTTLMSLAKICKGQLHLLI